MTGFIRSTTWKAAAFLALIILLVMAGHPAPCQPALTFGPDDQAVALHGHMALLQDPTGHMTLDDVLAPPMRDRFVDLPISLSLGYVPTAAWLRFTLRNTGPAARRLFLDFEPPFIDHVDVFVPVADRPVDAAGFSLVRLGDHVPIAQKPLFNLNNVLPVELAPGQDREFYVRVQTSSSLMLRGTLRTERSLDRNSALITAVVAMYVGMSLVVGLINLIFWWWVRAAVHFWYAAYVFTLGALCAANAGVPPVWMFPGHPEWSDIAVGASACLGCATACCFTIVVLELRTRAPILYRIYQALAVYALIGLGATLAGHYQQIAGLLNLSALALLFVAVGQSFRLARQGFGPARLFFVSFAAQLAGLSFNILRVVGLLPTMEWTDYGYQAASAVHMILMNIGLARQIKEANAKAHAAQAEALALAQQAESRAQAIAVERTRDFEAARLRAEAAFAAEEIAKRRAEDALTAEQEAQRAQVRLIDVISHQYRTPLSVIETNAEGIDMSLPGEDTTNRRRVDRIQRAVTRLVAMIDISLNRSRLEGAPLAPRLRPVAPSSLLHQTVRRVSDAAGDRDIRLDLDPAVEAVEIAADPEMIELALTNLIENALKFSSPDRPVDVTARVDGASLLVAVRDQGIGIPAADAELIFQKFFRASNATDRPGAGIGLRLVAQLVKAHGGEITVTSAEGRGATFQISLPVAEAATDGRTLP